MKVEVYKKDDPRLRHLLWLAAILFAVLAGGLFYRQIIQGPEFRRKVKRQNYRRILQPGPRGDIYDRNGRLLAGTRPRYSAVVYMNELRPRFRREYIGLVKRARQNGHKYNRDVLRRRARANVVSQCVSRINTILGRREQIEADDVNKHFRQNLLLPFTLVSGLRLGEYAKLVENIPVNSPIQLHTEAIRYYPRHTAAVHALGYVVSSWDFSGESLPGQDLITCRFKGLAGRTGIEKTFDEHLRGRMGGEIWVVDPAGRQYELRESVPPEKGEDLMVSLDIDLQMAAEKAMAGKVGAAAALDVRTGEVLAMVSLPSYDLNDLSPYIPRSVDREIRRKGAWLNRASQGLYPPGSTFKLVTAAAGLRAGLIGPGTVIDCPGFYEVGGRKFLCHRHAGHGPETFEEAIRDSCNVYFYQTGLKAGVARLAAEARLFGFHQPTGINLMGETRHMLVPDPEWKMKRLYENWYPGDTANLSIGQGFLLVTPLQMACFAASVARNETRTRPTLEFNPSPASVRHGGKPSGLSERQHKRIIEGMEQAVYAGTARLARLPGIRLAGKTGTAQVRAHGEDLTLAWFICFGPAEDPRIALAILIEGTDPRDNFHGGSTAAPVGRAILETYFRKTGRLP